MNCDRFPEEHYAFYVLGQPEYSERQAINDHMHRNCFVCEGALKESADFWYTYGAATSSLPEFQTIPLSPALRRRIMNSIRPTSVRQYMVPAYTWMRYAAGGVIVAGAAFSGWNTAQTLSRKDLRQAIADLRDQRDKGQQFEAENRLLRTGATPAPTATASTEAPRANPAPRQIDDPRVPMLEQDLESSRAALTVANQALSDQQALVSQTEAALAERTAQVAAATKDLTAAESRYQQVVRTASEQRELVAQRESEVAAFRRAVQELETQVTEYRRVVEIQRQNLSQHTRMVAMLQTPNVSLVQLQGTESARNASGVALIADGSTVAFFASNLPPVQPGRTYQLWLMRRNGPAIVSAGTFTRGLSDGPTVQFSNSELTKNVTGVAVSEEPAGGSPLPTGHKFLIGTKKG